MAHTLQDDITWLHGLLDQVAPPSRSFDALRDAAAHMLESDASPEDRPLRDLPAEEIQHLLKRLAIRFHLRNKAEQVHIARVNRRRECDSAVPRPESIREAVLSLAAQGKTRDEVRSLLAGLDIQPTLTAHPTETRRRAVLTKQHQIAACLTGRRAHGITPAEASRNESRVRQLLALLLATDEVRGQRLDVLDEVRNGLHALSTIIWDAVPAIARDIDDAMREAFGPPPAAPAESITPTSKTGSESRTTPITPVRYRSWIGGDRDGNPNVTAALTRRTLDMLHDTACALWADEIELLRRDLSVSARRVAILPELTANLAQEGNTPPVDPESLRHLEHEPFRVKLLHMRERLRHDRAYTANQLHADLDLLRRALEHAGLHETAGHGRIADLLVRSRAFGLHLAAIDVRQHSRVHEAAVAEMLDAAGVTADYADLDEPARLGLLHAELALDRPLLSRRAELSEATRELLNVFELLAETIAARPGAIGSYVISMTSDRSDLLEVLVLMREVGLWRRVKTDAGVRVESDLDISPLFETVRDLAGSGQLVRDLFTDPIYREHLRARGMFQEIMLGYSDSNKDGGYWMANWRLHRAQADLARACTDAGVTLRFFHGRGGTVARGGGRAHRAILSAPRESRSGRIRFTEQGEVITFRYTLPDLARRHLEQIVNATLLAAASATAPDVSAATNTDSDTQLDTLMDTLSDSSMQHYRELVDRPDFWPWFLDSSPVLHIGKLPIASRPVSRPGTTLTFETIRAIPWVFSWTQMRANIPGWFGLGTAFESLVLADPDRLALCREAYREGATFRTFIDNAQQEMARARLPVARAYSRPGSGTLDLVIAEFARARAAVLAVTGQAELLDNNPVIQRSIHERNPDTDLINAVQIELMHRCREARSESGPDRERLQQLMLLSINALAAAMQSTG